MQMTTKIFLTILTLGYSLGPALADFNKTHATNPLWTGHARFHVVWQVVSYILIAALMLGILWAPGPYETGRMWLVWTVAACVYGAFFITLGTMSMYDGANYDDNAYPPFTVKLPGAGNRLLDLNTTVFSGFVTLLVVTLALLALR